MFTTIVLGLDGSESSDRALEAAATLAKEQGSSVCVVHVVEILAVRGGGHLRLDESEVRTRVEKQARELVVDGIDARFECHSAYAGGPAHVIAQVAEAIGADLIVTGTRGHTAAAGIVLGSVAHRLLHLAHCPLLVIPPAVKTRTAMDPAVGVESIPSVAMDSGELGVALAREGS